ncbi:MAG: DUF2344 domain-containing protein [Chloroflexi bacterium]|nr:DUF2344 domain-containing protein [Chloroflexota bacterium]
MDVPPDRTPEPRQRWRLVVGRTADAPRISSREVVEAWEAAFVASDLPVAWDVGRARPRISFGAPLGPDVEAEGELIDIVLVERMPTWRVREALEGRLPEGWAIVDLFDVWLAGPPLAGRVAAADHRVVLSEEVGTPGVGGPVDAVAIARAASTLLATRTLPRERPKGVGTVRYDLRPLLLDVAVADAGPPVVIRARTRFHPELGTGRPEEVVAALGDMLGRVLVPARIVRERLLLGEDLG